MILIEEEVVLQIIVVKGVGPEAFLKTKLIRYGGILKITILAMQNAKGISQNLQVD
ncbi:hypothetical protein [uncultured Duncaniella sp.]|uniref:hypothetical protein n=1 Tax=uncultured Duncaniella sp. TaxID=2768039 RepID=UPI0026658FF8|nr:hypothetical protein [uncultured Duncaniella sp.]